MVLAENSWETGTVVPCRIRGGGGDGMVIFRAFFAYPIGWIGIIASTIP